MQLGAIFDFDGVIFHSDLAHEACWRTVAESEGRAFSRADFLKGFGVKNERFITEVLGWTDDPIRVAQLIERKERLFQERARKEGLAPIPGTADLISRLVKARVPCAIGSSAMRANIDIVMAPYPELQSAFSVCVSGEEVHKGKPDPTVFLLAAERLHVPPASCIVFEDAPLGVEAGKRAGMKVVALTTSFSEEDLRAAHPDMLVETLASVTLEDLFALVQNR
jgi:HAD superfamily hydrolase (TIGR01509 family)